MRMQPKNHAEFRSDGGGGRGEGTRSRLKEGRLGGGEGGRSEKIKEKEIIRNLERYSFL